MRARYGAGHRKIHNGIPGTAHCRRQRQISCAAARHHNHAGILRSRATAGRLILVQYNLGTLAERAQMERSALAPLDSIVFNEDLEARPCRPPDYEKENRVLSALVRGLAESPKSILQTLTEEMLAALEADSAGISLLTDAEGTERFYWPAIAGKWKPFIGGGTPRDFGPCGDVLDRDCPLLFRGIERRYLYYEPVQPRVEECLLVPFYLESKAVGTLWIVAHDKSRQFDGEDLRLMQSLAHFASAAYKTVNLIEDLKQHSERLEASESELRHRITDLQRTTEELKWANVDLKHFTYAASHDLKEPLRAISAYCELLLRRSQGALGKEAAIWGDFITGLPANGSAFRRFARLR